MDTIAQINADLQRAVQIFGGKASPRQVEEGAMEKIDQIKADLRAALERAIADVQEHTGLPVRGVDIRFETLQQVGRPPQTIVGDIDFDLRV